MSKEMLEAWDMDVGDFSFTPIELQPSQQGRVDPRAGAASLTKHSSRPQSREGRVSGSVGSTPASPSTPAKHGTASAQHRSLLGAAPNEPASSTGTVEATLVSIPAERTVSASSGAAGRGITGSELALMAYRASVGTSHSPRTATSPCPSSPVQPLLWPRTDDEGLTAQATKPSVAPYLSSSVHTQPLPRASGEVRDQPHRPLAHDSGAPQPGAFGPPAASMQACGHPAAGSSSQPSSPVRDEQPITGVSGQPLRLKPQNASDRVPNEPEWTHFYPAAAGGSLNLGYVPVGPYLKQDPVEEVLGAYHTSQAIDSHIAHKTARRVDQLQQFEALKGPLQAAQDASLQGPTGSLQRGQVPQLQQPRGRWASAGRTRRMTGPKHGAAAPYHRFLAGDIMQDGMYIASKDYDFAGSRPMRSDGGGGLLFERYTAADGGLPPVQHYYFRPTKPTQPIVAAAAAQKQPATLAVPAAPDTPPPAKILPNGIPVSRLQHLRHVQEVSAARARIRAAAAELPLGCAGAPADQAGSEAAQLSTVGPYAAPGAGPVWPDSAQQQEVTQRVEPSGAMAALGAASKLGTGSAEPLLDDAFYALIRGHFDVLAQQQTQRLQRKLNASLPVLLQSFGCSPAALPQ